MSDVQFKINTKEEVAYKLAIQIANTEGVMNNRKKLLDLYAECLKATSNNRLIDKE